MNQEKIIIISQDPSAYEELVGGARSLGAEPVALYAGPAGGAEQIASYGARVLDFGELPAGRLFDDYADAFEAAIREEGADVILARSSKPLQNIAGKLAVRLGAGVVSDASSVAFDGDDCVLTHLVYGGTAVRTEKTAGPIIALVGSGVFEPAPAEGGTVEKREASVEDGPFKLIDVVARQEEQVDLGAAKIVVCVGRGIGTEENLAKAQELAASIGAEMACTRPIAEGQGWMSRSRYLGVSGATVKPDLYIGMGISGQVQHTVGMSDSKVVVAVNKDKSAPIFKQCDYGIVCGVEDVLPALVAAF